MLQIKQLHNKHLLWRAGFGISAEDIPLVDTISTKDLYAQIEKKSAGKPAEIGVDETIEIKKLLADKAGYDNARDAMTLSENERRMLRKMSADGIRKLNLRWMDEMVVSGAQLREKMAFFWHGHFACRVQNVYHQQLLLQTIRENALGNFSSLLMDVSKSAAMLQFLNNQQNKKGQPNENFAREVMELFTLGRGNYTEQDIKEAARAFTGWGHNLKSEFVERTVFHDTGTKTVLGKTGNFSGDDVMRILLEQKTAAVFIARKIYRYFVNDIPDEEKIQALATRFYDSGYDIKDLMKHIFTSAWFYDEKNIGSKIKSPVELIVGLRRILPMQINPPELQVYFQRLLGQTLFYPPNVAGWPGGKNWIDSSTLMTRLRIPATLAEGTPFLQRPKSDDDLQMGIPENENAMLKPPERNTGNLAGARIQWNKFITAFSKIPSKEMAPAIQQMLLQTNTSSSLIDLPESDSRDKMIQSLTIGLMCTPEYQLC